MISKKKIRKVYEPLTVVVSTEVTGPLSQVFDSMLNTYSPDRTVKGSETCIQPKVVVTTGANDRTWANGNYTSSVRYGQWFANGQPISTVESLRGKYSIDETGTDTNYRLTLRGNLSPAEHYDFHFEGQLRDTRNNGIVPVKTDLVTVDVSEIAPDEWDLSVVHDTSIKYHPLFDLLKEYDWKVANGVMADSPTERRKCMDGNQYELTLPIIVSSGNTIVRPTSHLWKDVELHLYAMINGEAVQADDVLFVRSIDMTKPQIVLDQRLIPDGTVMQVRLYYKKAFMSSVYLTFSIVIDDYTCDPSNEGDINTKAATRPDRAVCVCKGNGRPMPYPEAYLSINWYTNTALASGVYHGCGETISLNMANARLGDGDNCWLEVYTESMVKAYVAAISLDDTGSPILVDGDSNVVTADVLVGAAV